VRSSSSGIGLSGFAGAGGGACTVAVSAGASGACTVAVSAGASGACTVAVSAGASGDTTSPPGGAGAVVLAAAPLSGSSPVASARAESESSRPADVRAVIRDMPDDRIIVETDCPYLAPVPHRGRRNEPAYVGLVLDQLAQIRGWDRAEALARTADAFFALFDRVPRP